MLPFAGCAAPLHSTPSSLMRRGTARTSCRLSRISFRMRIGRTIRNAALTWFQPCARVAGMSDTDGVKVREAVVIGVCRRCARLDRLVSREDRVCVREEYDSGMLAFVLTPDPTCKDRLP